MRAFRVLMILPPDVHAPEIQRHHRFPPQGPAIVAASVAPEGFSMRVADLELSVYERPLDTPLTELDWAERVDAMLCDRGTPTLEALADELIDRLGSVDEIPDAYAFSLDRHTQANVAALLDREWVDDAGGAFRARLVDLFDPTAGRDTFDSRAVVAALRSGRPLVLGTTSHAMLLIGAAYRESEGRLSIVEATVFDPWPNVGVRTLRADEMTPLAHHGSLAFIADVVVTD